MIGELVCCETWLQKSDPKSGKSLFMAFNQYQGEFMCSYDIPLPAGPAHREPFLCIMTQSVDAAMYDLFGSSAKEFGDLKEDNDQAPLVVRQINAIATELMRKHCAGESQRQAE